MVKLKTGKKAATYDQRDLRLVDYLTDLPLAPKTFGHEKLIDNWGMLGNDQFGDCVLAGAAHETMLWNKEAGKDIKFSEESVLSDYSAITGFNLKDPNSDQGTDMRAALNYRRKIGILDASGNRHKIGAYVALEPGNMDHIFIAMYLFSSINIGIIFPNSAMNQFNKGKPWSVVHGATQEGSHLIPCVGRPSFTYMDCVTWGRLQRLTTGFFKTYCDEAYAVLSEEMIVNGKTIDGFDLKSLQKDLLELGK